MPHYTQAQLAAQLVETQRRQDELLASSTQVMHDDEDVIPLEERMMQAAREKAAWEHAMGLQQQETQQHMLGQLQTLMQTLDGQEDGDGDGDMEMESGTVAMKSQPIEIPQFIYHDVGDEIPPMSNSPSLGSIAPPSETQLIVSCTSCGLPNYSFQYEQLFHQHVGSCYINKHVKTPLSKPIPGILPQVNKQHLINQIRDAVSKLDSSQRTSLMDAFKKLSGAGQNGNQQSIAHVLSMLYTPATQAQDPTNSPSFFSLESSQPRSHQQPPPPPPQYLDPQFYAHQMHLYDQLDGSTNPQYQQLQQQQQHEQQQQQQQQHDSPQSSHSQVQPTNEQFWYEEDVIPPEEREYHRQQHAAYLAQQEQYYREQEEMYAQQQASTPQPGSYHSQQHQEYDEYDDYDGYGYEHPGSYPHHPAYQYHQYANYSPDSPDYY